MGWYKLEVLPVHFEFLKKKEPKTITGIILPNFDQQ
jgi:hypothetical protein